MSKLRFELYESKPVTRSAYRITAEDKVQALPDCTFAIGEGVDTVFFKAYELPKVGDYVVWLKDDDIYHCSEAVFRERNVVED